MRVRYLEAGAEHGGTPLVIVHGYNGSCDYWRPHTVMGMAAERHVVAVDLPGHGLSDKMPVTTLETLSLFLPRFVSALGHRQADLMGHSMGGLVSVAAVEASPRSFRRLALVDSAGLPTLERRLWLVPLRALADSSLRQWRLYPTFLKIALRARTPGETLHIICTADIGPRLAQLSIPTLILWGRNDRVVPLEHGRRMAELIPRAQFKIIEGAGHMPFYERPQECNRIVLDFLRGGG